MFEAVRPSVSVVVPSRDRPEKVDRCLASLRKALREGDELVLVDSASRDSAAVAAVADRHGARLVRCDRPGVDRARNAGWAVTTHPLVLFTDDDVELDVDWADAFVAAFVAHPEAAFLTGWVGVPDGQSTANGVAIKDDAEPAVLDRSSRGTLGHGASMAIRREALEALGGWDESLGAGARFQSAPEVDLFDRLLGSGRTGRFEPTSRAWHDQWRSDGQMTVLHFRYGMGMGARLAKLRRTDRERMRVVRREALWDWGLRSFGEHLRHRNARHLVLDLLRFAGYAVGFVVAARTPVVAGHFRVT